MHWKIIHTVLSYIKNHKVLLCVFLMGLTFRIFSQSYDLREYSDGLAQPYVYSITQDNKGYLWIGTGNGLSRYDGFTFKTFTTSDSLAGNFISCSFKNDGDVWFGHMNGNITHFDGRSFKPVITPEHKSGITDIDKSPDGEIWAATFSNGLIRLNTNAGSIQDTTKNDQIGIFTFKFITDNELLVGSVNGISYCRLLRSGEVEIISHVDEIPETKISDIIKRKDGTGYYIATENEGIFQLVPEGNQFKVTKIGSELNLNLSGIQSLLEDSESNLWISTFGNGLIKLTHSGSDHFNDAKFFNLSTGFSTDYVKTAYEDREGNIWSGNYGTGLTQIIRKTFSLYSFDENKYGTSILSIYAHNGYWWLGTDKGLLKIQEPTGKVVKFYSSENGLPNNKITAIYADQSNNLWIGTATNGVYLKSPDKDEILPFKIGKGILENSITAITGKNDQVWIGTKKGVCNINLTSDSIRWYNMINGGLPHNYVNQLYMDLTGRLWITTKSNILTSIKEGKVSKIMISSDKAILSLGSVAVGKDSTIWIGSNGSGIFRIKSDSIINLTSKEGLFSDFCYSLITDNENNIWVGHRGGLSKIRASDLFVKPVQQYAGIKNSCEFNLNAVFKDKKNRILFGSDEGLWVYDPSSEDKTLLPPVLNITSIKVNDEDVDLTKKLVLPPGNYKLKIEFLGISLKEPALVGYQYQLKGLDNSPENTKLNSVTYPHLSNGKYTFILNASSGDGVISASPATLNIVIKTPVWKLWWFYVFIFILLVLTVIFYIKQREYKFLREKRVLEEKVNERTAEITEKNRLLEEDQEKITNQNIELEKYRNYLEDLVAERTKELLEAKNKAEESDKLKTAFLNNLSHEIRTPLNAISGFSELLSNDLSNEDRKEFLTIINNNIDSLLFLFDDIMDMSLINTGQFVLSNETFKVNEVLEILENDYKFNNIKNIEFEFINKSKNNGLELYTDKERFRRIFINLLNNAFKFTESGAIKFGYEAHEKSVHFFVSDTGIGIEKSEIDKIFDPFYKVEKNTEKLYRGTGIGLTTFKEMVELMGGEVWVESVINKGSVFNFSLPITTNY